MTAVNQSDAINGLFYSVGSDSLPTGNSEYIAFGNRQFYQARGYAEVAQTAGSALPVFLSNHPGEKRQMLLPPTAQITGMRICTHNDSLSGVGSDSNFLYASTAPVPSLSADPFPPRIPATAGTAGSSPTYRTYATAVSGGTTNFQAPLGSTGAVRPVSVYTSGTGGVRVTNPKTPISHIGVEVEFMTPYSAINVNPDRIIIL